MEFRVLGPLEVENDGRLLDLGGAGQRVVLALLLTCANEVVSVDRLIDALWGAAPPKRAANTVQQYVSRLRKLLGADRITTRPPGYAVRVAPEELDLQRFERLLSAGDRAGLHEALRLWRGAPLADLAYESFAQPEIARLEELRLTALEQRIDADLGAGADAELVGELEGLVREHPLRERLRGQLMLALYRAGRQAESLSAYRAAREALVGELGIEPSAALQELEQAILRHDPALGQRDPAAGARRHTLLVAPSSLGALDRLLMLAEPLACRPPRELIVAALVRQGEELRATTAALDESRRTLAGRGVTARVVAYTSDAPGEEVAVLAREQDADLVLVDASEDLLEVGELGIGLSTVCESAPCDVAMLVKGDMLSRSSGGPIVVPFGGVEHDWAAIEVAAWLARALDVSLRLAGTDGFRGRRDASRLLGRASLVLQAAAGVVAEPALVSPGPEGMTGATDGASLLVVGLSERWRSEGVGVARLALARAARVPTVLVRHGLRPGGLAPPHTVTRFTWTLAS